MEDRDLTPMRVLDSDPEVVRYLGHGKIRNEEETRSNLLKIFNDYQTYGLGLYLVEDQISSEFLGRAGLIPWSIDGELIWEIGYSFRPAAWGRGYATEVARHLADWGVTELRQQFLVSLIHPQNTSSIHVAKKIGMVFWKNQKIGSYDLATYRLLGASSV